MRFALTAQVPASVHVATSGVCLGDEKVVGLELRMWLSSRDAFGCCKLEGINISARNNELLEAPGHLLQEHGLRVSPKEHAARGGAFLRAVSLRTHTCPRMICAANKIVREYYCTMYIGSGVAWDIGVACRKWPR